MHSRKIVGAAGGAVIDPECGAIMKLNRFDRLAARDELSMEWISALERALPHTPATVWDEWE